MVPIIIFIVTLIQSGLTQYLAGTVPSLPNPTFEGCQRDTLPLNYTSNYTSVYAQVIDRWCRTYDEVLPCVDDSLPFTRLSDFNDWYLSMMFDLEIAKNTSRDMCNNWEDYAEQITCVERSRRATTFCMQFKPKQLSTILLQLYYQNKTEDPNADVIACSYANETANCLTRHMRHCKEPITHIINKYFSLLHGKCDAILLENLQEHKNKTAANTQKRQKLARELKTLIPTKRQENNTKERKQTMINQASTTKEPIPAKMSKEQSPKTNTVEKTGNATEITTLVENVTGNTTTVKPKTKTRRKKTRKSKKERVKLELRKLLSMVLGGL